MILQGQNRLLFTMPPTSVRIRSTSKREGGGPGMNKYKLLPICAAFIGLGAAGPADATLFDFTYSGSLVTFTIPTTDTYQILAFGAQGGSGTANQVAPGVGGRG